MLNTPRQNTAKEPDTTPDHRQTQTHRQQLRNKRRRSQPYTVGHVSKTAKDGRSRATTLTTNTVTTQHNQAHPVAARSHPTTS
eukprot:11617340-Prorocentrum_lima.AAC.1